MRAKRHFKPINRTCVTHTLSFLRVSSALLSVVTIPYQTLARTPFDLDQDVQLVPFQESREQDGQADQEVGGGAFQVEDAAEARQLNGGEV